MLPRQHMETMIGNLNHDLLGEILARVDGPTLASAACVSTSLRNAAGEKRLWQDLCHSTWPSTKEENTAAIIASIPGGFAKFYGLSLPLLLYNPTQEAALRMPCDQEEACAAAPPDLVSMIDLFCDGRSVFSKVLHGIPTHESGSWFFHSPFKLEVLVNDDGIGQPTVAYETERGGGPGELQKRLEEDMRLSWVMLDSKTGKAVNLSSWKPRLVDTYWPSEGEVLMRFGCVVQHVRGLKEFEGADGASECVISVWFRRFKNEAGEGLLRLVEMEMQMEDVDGVPENGQRNLAVLGAALRCPTRSRDHRAVEEAYRGYEKRREEGMQRYAPKERVADRNRMWEWCGAAILTFFCYCVCSLTANTRNVNRP